LIYGGRIEAPARTKPFNMLHLSTQIDPRNEKKIFFSIFFSKQKNENTSIDLESTGFGPFFPKGL
jgi:hypothetical protein